VHGQQPVGPLQRCPRSGASCRPLADQCAQAPVSERQPELARSGGGRLDEEDLVLDSDPAGTATRPARVQRPHPEFVELMEQLPDGVLVASTSRAIAGTVFPLAEVSTTFAGSGSRSWSPSAHPGARSAVAAAPPLPRSAMPPRARSRTSIDPPARFVVRHQLDPRGGGAVAPIRRASATRAP
jgi:hypothetical protein